MSGPPTRGHRHQLVRVRALLLSGLLAAVAAFFVMARSPIGNPQIGTPFALNSITAAVLGGASLAGGRATFVGSTVASILLALIITVLPFLGLSPDDGSMIIGLLVLAGIVLFQVGDLKELVKRNYRRGRRLVLGSRVVEILRSRPSTRGNRFLGRPRQPDPYQERHRAQPRPTDR